MTMNMSRDLALRISGIEMYLYAIQTVYPFGVIPVRTGSPTELITVRMLGDVRERWTTSVHGLAESSENEP